MSTVDLRKRLAEGRAAEAELSTLLTTDEERAILGHYLLRIVQGDEEACAHFWAIVALINNDRRRQ